MTRFSALLFTRCAQTLPGLVLGFVLGLTLVLTGPVQAQTAAAEAATLALDEALAGAPDGAIVEVPAGTYSVLRLRDRSFPDGRPLILRPADPANPPRFLRMNLRGVENVIVEDMVFDYAYTAGDEGLTYPFRVRESRNVILRNNLFEGDPAPDGFGNGVGLEVRANQGVVIENNEIRGFRRGIIVSYTDDIMVVGNDLHSMRSDGMNFAQVDRVLIEGNRIYNFAKNPTTGDHPDMIQFWTAGTRFPSTDITIRNNWLLAGSGGWTQSIFIRNEMVDTRQAGDEMYYQNILIEGNLIVNAHLHGITVGETDGLQILNNTVVRIAAAEGPDNNPALWTPVIRLSGRSRDVTVARNITGGFNLPEELPTGWQVFDNFVVQDRSRLQPSFYGTVFAGSDPADPASFRPLPGGPLDGAGIGSPLP